MELAVVLPSYLNYMHDMSVSVRDYILKSVLQTRFVFTQSYRNFPRGLKPKGGPFRPRFQPLGTWLVAGGD